MFAPLGPDETPRNPPVPEDEWQPMPAPNGASPDFRHHELGPPSRIWQYTNAAGELEGYVCRFETKTPDGPDKEFRPRRYGTLTKDGKARTGWHWKGWGANRPLYGIGDLLARPDAPVLVVEGEKKVDAARRLFPDYVPVAPMNGTRSPHKTHWTPLAGRVVVIWPDNDPPGSVFATAAVKLNPKAASVAIVTIPENFPEGWDLADTPPDGVDHEDLVGMLDAARRSKSNADHEISDDDSPLPNGHDRTPKYVSFGPYKMTEHGLFSEKEIEVEVDAEPATNGEDVKAKKKTKIETKRTWLASAFEVLAKTRDSDGSDWGILLRWKDPDGRQHEWAMPRRSLRGRYDEIWGELLDRGMDIAAAPALRNLLAQYLSSVSTEVASTAFSVPRVGWYVANPGVFVLSDETYGSVAGNRVLWQTETRGSPHYGEEGSMDDWA